MSSCLGVFTGSPGGDAADTGHARPKRGQFHRISGPDRAALRPAPLNFSARPVKHDYPLRLCNQKHVMAETPIPVCAAADLPPGSVKSFDLGSEMVAVYNIDGTFYATEARCTHATADLADGILDGDVIECSLHFGAFNVRTGKAV